MRSDRYYTYDKAGRLTQVDDITGNPAGDATVPCTRRGYGFDVNGNRTSQTSATNPGCVDTGAATLTRAYNGADQPTTGANAQGAYSYDPLGRQTSIPAADTANPSRGDMALGYYDTDAAQSISQGDVRVTFTLDGAGRRLVQNTTVGPVAVPGAVAGTVVRHYTDASDNPAWTVEVRDGTQTTTRFGSLTGDGLGITYTITSGGTTAELALAGLRGDINATITLDGTNPAAGIDVWRDWTEYGQPGQPVTSSAAGSAAAGYGWLGQYERATLDALGVTLMGARLYNLQTGLFTSLDPVYGGNATSYGYPNDPVMNRDTTGRYAYSFDFSLGWGSRHTSPQHLGYVLTHAFAAVFPIPSLCWNRWVGRRCSLSGNPVRVTSRWSTGMQFLSLPGHKEGAGKHITFNIYKGSWGILHLRVTAWGPDVTKCDRNRVCAWGNKRVAKAMWRQLAANLVLYTL